ncbi:MAG TPA: hypothetical protein VHZ26_17880 [Caulobacteraceae bacterium]|jgi:hypothetical protein|nr:hypothetical protein [Caulobacteraceae bacterium]
MVLEAAWVEAIGTLLTGVATILAGIAALRGLNAWRLETVGRRKAELAEEVLAQFYRARDILTWARFPIRSDDREVAAPAGETAHDVSERRRAFAPVERLAQESQIFSDLQASRYRFMAYFGEEAARPFDEIRALQSEVISAADKLIRAQGKPETLETKAGRDAWESAIGWGAAEDRVAQRLAQAVKDIEAVCRPLIDERTSPTWSPNLTRTRRPTAAGARRGRAA